MATLISVFDPISACLNRGQVDAAAAALLAGSELLPELRPMALTANAIRSLPTDTRLKMRALRRLKEQYPLREILVGRTHKELQDIKKVLSEKNGMPLARDLALAEFGRGLGEIRWRRELSLPAADAIISGGGLMHLLLSLEEVFRPGQAGELAKAVAIYEGLAAEFLECLEIYRKGAPRLLPMTMGARRVVDALPPDAALVMGSIAEVLKTLCQDRFARQVRYSTGFLLSREDVDRKVTGNCQPLHAVAASLGLLGGLRFCVLYHADHVNLVEPVSGLVFNLTWRDAYLSSLDDWKTSGSLGAFQKPAGLEAFIAGTLCHLAEGLRDRNEYHMLMQAALEVFPSLTIALCNLAQRTLDKDTANALVERAAAIDPHGWHIASTRAVISLGEKRYVDAESESRKALQILSRNEAAVREKGSEPAVSRRRSAIDTRVVLIQALSGQHKIPEAISMADEILEADPENRDVCSKLSLCPVRNLNDLSLVTTYLYRLLKAGEARSESWRAEVNMYLAHLSLDVFLTVEVDTRWWHFRKRWLLKDLKREILRLASEAMRLDSGQKVNFLEMAGKLKEMDRKHLAAELLSCCNKA